MGRDDRPDFFAEAFASPEEVYSPDGVPGPEPEWVGANWNRTIRYHYRLDSRTHRRYVTVEDARREIWKAMTDFAAHEPEYLPVVKAPPGTGKTTLAIRFAEFCARQGLRVLYLGPRRDFFGDILAITRHPELWFAWDARQGEDPEHGKRRTCIYANEINTWQIRGYQAMDFCKLACGWSYIHNDCVYHQQKKRVEPIIFGQHQHLINGHPVDFDVVIGDENPQNAFCQHWQIPARFVLPDDLIDLDPRLQDVLERLHQAVKAGMHVEGPILLDALGGAQAVWEATNTINIPIDAEPRPPDLIKVSDVEYIAYFHLPKTVHILRREARACLDGIEYNTRIFAHNRKLHLLLRKSIHPKMPRRMVWMDATADQMIYEALFGTTVRMVEPHVRPRGRRVQVWDRLNGLGAFFEHQKLVDENGEEVKLPKKPTGGVREAEMMIQHLRERYPEGKLGIITHMQLKETFEDYPLVGHYYGERGTNRFADVDALVLLGTPQPPLGDIVKMAKMIFWDEMPTFTPGGKLPWETRWVPYEFQNDEGKWAHYPVAGFWGNEKLNALLRQYRECELLQAAHRARVNIRDCDVYLLTNIPIDELPPTDLIRLYEYFDAPKSIDCFKWQRVTEVAKRAWESGNGSAAITVQSLTQQAGVSTNTASRYLDMLIVWGREQGMPWRDATSDEVARLRGPQARGRKPRILVPDYEAASYLDNANARRYGYADKQREDGT